jgi:L-methionine (R)-S-oxide reductase
MSEELKIDRSLSDKEIYESLIPQIENLIVDEEPIISALSNVSAALKQAFSKISWVGFYLAKSNNLYLGPFQGKTACTIIPFGRGVCGTAASEQSTIIVDDVDKFPGHIACDFGSKSEIVVPIIIDDEVFGVLDIDSYKYGSFNTSDKIYLERIIQILLIKKDFKNFVVS